MINIFARSSFIGNRFHRWSNTTQTQRISSRVRGEEMASFLGDKAKLNPEKTNPEDINIYVKPENLDIVGQGDYLDFLDGGVFEEQLLKRPDIKIIVATENSMNVLRGKFKNKIFLIPHHHLNFDRLHKTSKKVSVCGYLGSYSPKTQRHYKWLQDRFKEQGLEVDLFANFEYKTREDAVNCYMNMDILVIADWWLQDDNPYKVPTKIINAASFGVPTIAFPRNGYKEIEGRYIKCNDLDQLIGGIIYFKENLDFYNKFSEMIREDAEKYHIEHSAKLYLDLIK